MMPNMGLNVAVLLFVFYLAPCVAFDVENEIETRGKKKKIALYVYLADLIIKKVFVLKLVYAVVFWLVIHKAGYFLAWFVGFLKEQKKSHAHPGHYPHYYAPYRKNGGPYRKESHGIS